MSDTPVVEAGLALAKLTSWRIGGRAQYFARPNNLAALTPLIEAHGKGPITWLGLGSNVLIRDQGIAGLVIGTRGLNKIVQCAPHEIYAEAGVASAKLARFSQQHGLGGGTFFAGIPGTVGGALAMNAGAFGGETWPVVKQVTIIDTLGQCHEKYPSDFEIGYRTVVPRFENFLGFVAATFKLTAQASATGQADIRALLQKRQQSQPIGTFNCGSVFRNPAGTHAAYLIEQAGLKGKRVGDAIISDKHANFILNLGHATAQDVETLISNIQTAVYDRFQQWLEPEVKIIGDVA